MNLEQLKAHLASIVSKLETFATVENYTDSDLEEINKLNGDFENTKKQIEAKEKIENMKAAAAVSNRKTSAAASPAAPAPKAEVNNPADKTNGFVNYGDFLLAAKKSSGGEMDKRFQNVATTSVDAEGGFLVPDEFFSDVTKRMSSDDALIARTRQFTVSSNNLTLPKDESSPWTGGVQATWLGENAQYSATTPNTLSEATFKLHKLGALVHVTDELIADAVALESYMRSMAPEAIVQKINEAIISGNGVGKPSGILSSSFAVTVAKESAQTADTINSYNVVKMYSRMLPASRAKAVWYINAMCEEQLRLLKDDNGNFIYLAAGSQMNQEPYALLLGRPVIPMLGSLPQLGDKGDIVFADLGYYYSIVKSNGVKTAVSSHLKFDYDLQSYKYTMRLDGKCPFQTPVTTQYGSYSMSGIVLLADRA